MMMSSVATCNRNFSTSHRPYLKRLGINPPASCFTFSITRLGNKRTNNINKSLQASKRSQHARSKSLQITSVWQWSDKREEREKENENVNENEIYLRGGEIPEFNSLSNFIRFCNNGDDGEELQTAVVTYRKQLQLPWSILQPQYQVDLVAAVHLADKEYFASFQRELASYDRVLYEMVADKDPQQTNENPNLRWMPPKRMPGVRSRRFGIVGIIQRLMAQILRLDFQLECLDYRMANWYHADLDYHTFKLMQFERGETMFKFARDMTILSSKAITKSVFVSKDLDPWRSKLLWASRVLPMPLVGLFLIESVCAHPSSPIGESPEMKALFRLDLAAAMKVFLAKQLTSELTDGTTDVVEKSVIIGERNKVAMEELQRAMHKGCKKIAILYGGGHMPDLDRRLRKDFGLFPTKISWRTAWSIKNQRTAGQKQLPSFLSSIAESSGWQLNRYQTIALMIFSSVLAVDLWFWELFLSSIKEWADQNLLAALQFLAQT